MMRLGWRSRRRAGALVVRIEVAVDGGLEVDQRVEGTALQAAAGEHRRGRSRAAAVLNLNTMESRSGRPPWRDLLKEPRHDRRRFAAAIGDKSVRSGPTSLGTMQ